MKVILHERSWLICLHILAMSNSGNTTRDGVCLSGGGSSNKSIRRPTPFLACGWIQGSSTGCWLGQRAPTTFLSHSDRTGSSGQATDMTIVSCYGTHGKYLVWRKRDNKFWEVYPNHSESATMSCPGWEDAWREVGVYTAWVYGSTYTPTIEK